MVPRNPCPRRRARFAIIQTAVRRSRCAAKRAKAPRRWPSSSPQKRPKRSAYTRWEGAQERPDVLRNVLLIARTSEDAIQVTFADFSSRSRPIPHPPACCHRMITPSARCHPTKHGSSPNGGFAAASLRYAGEAPTSGCISPSIGPAQAGTTPRIVFRARLEPGRLTNVRGIASQRGRSWWDTTNLATYGRRYTNL